MLSCILKVSLLVFMATGLARTVPVPTNGGIAEDVAAAASSSRPSTIREQGWGSGLKALFFKMRARFLRTSTAERMRKRITTTVPSTPTWAPEERSTSMSGTTFIPDENAIVAYRASDSLAPAELYFPPRRDMDLLTDPSLAGNVQASSRRPLPRGREIEARRAKKVVANPVVPRHRRPIAPPGIGAIASASPAASPQSPHPINSLHTPSAHTGGFRSSVNEPEWSIPSQRAEAQAQEGLELSRPSLRTFTFPSD